MENVGWGFLFFVVIFLAGLGAFHLIMDFRLYDSVYKQCKVQGFIQNNTTRIICKVE